MKKMDRIEDGVFAVWCWCQGVGGCEAEWFCTDCPFNNTFCDNLGYISDSKQKALILEKEAEKWLNEKGFNPIDYIGVTK